MGSCRGVGGKWLRRRRFWLARPRRNPRRDGSYVGHTHVAIAPFRRQRMVRSSGGGGAPAGARLHRGVAGGGAGRRARPCPLRASRHGDRPPPWTPGRPAGHHLRPRGTVGTTSAVARSGR
jgi:hypothetical protein